MKALITIMVLFFVGVIAIGVASDQPATRTPAPATNVYSPETLARASAMTQEMSANTPISGHEYHDHSGDEQLRLSSDPQFVRELEAYQAQIDQMLARDQ